MRRRSRGERQEAKVNAYELLARQTKARKIANALQPVLPQLAEAGYTVDDLLRPEAANARRQAEQQAGTNPGSEETWKLVIEILKERTK
jgi:hypothetical protein